MNSIIQKIINRVKRVTIYYSQYIKWIIFRPPYPNNENKKVYIHLGCGDINSPEFINVDGRFFPHIHHIHNVSKLNMFNDEFADLVYASHVLEHIPFPRLKDVLLEWKRILKKGGKLRIAVPDFDKIISIYSSNNNSIDSIRSPLLGSQGYKSNVHRAVFNYDYLALLLSETGFVNITSWDPNMVENHNFEDWASRNIHFRGREYPISLNIEAEKYQ